ncbi:class II peroxidase [Venturia nashicola]|uniref:Peroxidase n=1 Tax=Venturia nashicola TaxID=86259 RepID=A0A4Z1PHL2_9PEZI|nr:class II peroxidase [Venturia nashicola]TLD37304.1 class II peroxidase [Venturia nashicola]
MHFTNSIVALALLTSAQASLFSSLLAPRAASCPAVWTTISKELTKLFVTNLQCNDNARAAIRAVFHDCFPQGGCDGSLALFADELARPENTPMTATMNSLKALAVKYNVGVADMLMFAGSHAVVSCPGGPTTKTYIGRVDATAAAPPNQLPSANVSAADAKAHFAAAGFSSQDLAALIGSHTAARQFTVDTTKSGASEDSTPGLWDILYYLQLITKTSVFSFGVDKNLLADSDTGPIMKSFSINKSAWDAAFAPAMAKLEVLGAPFTQIDCTGALPKSLFKRSATQDYARSIINSLTMGRIAAF